jgi:hypothetical protein
MRRLSLRICQLTHVETNFKFLAPLFKALAQDGHEVVVACNLDRFAADPTKIIASPGVGVDIEQFSPRGAANGLAVRREWSIPEGDLFSDEELSDLDLAFVADPFAVHRNGLWHLFFEQVRQGSDQGEIGLATSSDLRTWTYCGAALAEPHHLSYPHIVDAESETFMIPAACASRGVRLYRATDFPFRWELVDVIIEGRPFKDSTLVEHDGSLFLFTETSARHTQDELQLFVAADVRGPWTEHPASPLVVRNADAARPAGQIVEVDGQLVRLTQCCSQRYGAGVRAHVIERISPSEYRESRLYQQVLQPSGSGWNGRPASDWPQAAAAASPAARSLRVGRTIPAECVPTTSLCVHELSVPAPGGRNVRGGRYDSRWARG